MSTKLTLVEIATLVGLVGAVVTVIGAVVAPPILDSQNPRTVTIDATTIQFSVPQPKGVFSQPQVLTESTAPTGDFEVIASTPEGKATVLRVDDSFPRWWKEQRRETYANLQGARRVGHIGKKS